MWIPIRIKYNKITIIITNLTFLFGFIFFMGGIIASIQVNKDYYANYVDKESLKGLKFGLINKIDTIIPTSGEGDGEPYYKIIFKYSIDTFTFSGLGYSYLNKYKINDNIIVHYKIDNPKISIADNLRSSETSKESKNMIWILPIFGLLILVLSFKRSYDLFCILDNGFITTAYLDKIYKDRKENNYVNIYKFTDDLNRERVVRFYSINKEIKKEVLVLFQKNKSFNNIGLKELFFLGSSTIKNKINSAANTRS